MGNSKILVKHQADDGYGFVVYQSDSDIVYVSAWYPGSSKNINLSFACIDHMHERSPMYLTMHRVLSPHNEALARVFEAFEHWYLNIH